MNLFNVKNFNEFKKRYEKQNFEILKEFLQIVKDLDYFTLQQTLKEIQDQHFSHLTPIFESYKELSFFTQDQKLQEKIFNAMDKNNLVKIDGFEIIVFIHFSIQGNLEDVFENFICDVAGKENECINRDMFFYYFDAFFRALPKLTKLKQQDQQIMRIARLGYIDLEEFSEKVFQEEENLKKIDVLKFCEENKKDIFIEFLNHLKNVLNDSLIQIDDQQKSMNENIQIEEESLQEISLESSKNQL